MSGGRTPPGPTRDSPLLTHRIDQLAVVGVVVRGAFSIAGPLCTTDAERP